MPKVRPSSLFMLLGWTSQVDHLPDDWFHVVGSGGEDSGVLEFNVMFLCSSCTVNKMNTVWRPCLSSLLVRVTIPQMCCIYS